MENQTRAPLALLQARGLPGWVTSTVVHAVALVVLMFVPIDSRPPIEELVVEQDVLDMPTETQLVQDIQQPVEIQPDPQVLAAETPAPTNLEAGSTTPDNSPAAASDANDIGNPLMAVAKAIDGGAAAVPIGKGKTEGFSGRGSGKGLMIGKGGGTHATEFAVKIGLDWFIKHQFEDGHWDINYTRKSTGATTGVGDVKSNMAATSLALLPFLAANHTHQTGQHRAVVKKALSWMLENQDPVSGRLLAKGDVQEMYSHGLGSIVLCEAYALTKDKQLGAAAQKAINFSVQKQNDLGGWHYTSSMKSVDTSVFGWQFMSLKSGLMAGLKVPEKTLNNAMGYLKTVEPKKPGEHWAYMPNAQRSPSMTAIGLLCHQYMGKGRNDELIEKGVKLLIDTAPPDKTRAPYYWYYGTQVVHHYQGPEWEKWNRAMRKIWVDKQIRDPRSTDYGSWNPKDFSGEHGVMEGGRLYLASIGLLTLEVYYRYLPLYEGIKATETKTASRE